MHELIELMQQNKGIQAFGLSLLHSIWQAGAIAVLLWLLLALIGHSSTRLRYWLAFTALCSLLVCFGCTLYLQLQRIPSPDATAGAMALEAFASSPSTQEPVAAEGIGELLNRHWSQFYFWAQWHMGYIFLAWAAGFLAFNLRFFSGLYFLKSIETSSTPLPEQWLATSKLLTQKLGLHKKVKLLTSDTLDTPLTFGWLRPVVIFPLSLISLLPQEQVETILLHELAHIQRNDYLVNLLQSLVEILFFFNPGYWYIASILEKEREFLCDDLVLAHSSNATTYAKALANLAELSMVKNHRLALQVAENRGNLLFRIKRIIHPPTFATMEKSTKRRSYQLAFLVIAFGFLFFLTLDVSGRNEPLRHSQTEQEKNAAPAQRLLVKGTVLDMHGAASLAGVSVRIKNSDAGTLTDKEGNFSLQTNPDDTLMFAFIGYHAKEVALNGKSYHVVVLERTTTPTDSRLVITDVQVQENNEKAAPSPTTFSKTAVEKPGRIYVVPADASIKPFYAYISTAAILEPESVNAREITQSELQSLDKVQIQSRMTISSEASGSPRAVTIVKLRETEASEETTPQPSAENQPLYILLEEGELPSSEPGVTDYKTAYRNGRKTNDLTEIDPSSIAAIHVVKNEKALELLGEAGKNGIVYISLKSAVTPGVDEQNTPTEAQFSVFPNPTEGLVRVRFYNEQTQPVKVSVLNPEGAVIHTLADKQLGKGWHELQWNASGQASGIYSIMLAAPAGVKTKKLLIN